MALGNVIIAIDTVVDLGSFVEFEYASEADTVEAADKELSRSIEEIGVDLGDRDRRGYPYQLLERTR